jgi:archaellum biogenesis ATPase FlaH
MLDGKVLSACLMSRDAYESVRDHVEESELSLQGQTWWPLISRWYEGDQSARSVDKDILREKGKRELPEGHLDALIGWFDDLPEVDSPVSVVKDLLELKRYVKGNELCQAIQGRQNDRIEDLLSEFGALRAATELGGSAVTWTMDDTDMDILLNRENLIKVAPKRLNDRFKGGAVKGDTLLVFGRPEAGKTLFTVNMAAGFLKFGHRVLYVGNEEGTYKVRKRIINNLANSDNDAYEADPEGVRAKARSVGLDNLFICHMQPGSIPEIEQVVKEIKPDVVIVDQIRNLTASGKGAEKLTDRLGLLSTQLRSAAARHQFLAVAVNQAADKTERHGQEPPPWLLMSDIADNRTSMVGQFDMIVGVGCTEELRRGGNRAVSLCKNKNSDEDDAHEGFIVQVDVKRSKVR